MKTRRLRKQRGGMNCIGRFCRRLRPTLSFPAYDPPTLDNNPPGIEFYEKLYEYIKSVYASQKPSAMIDAFEKIKKLIESTNADTVILSELQNTQKSIEETNDSHEKAAIIFTDLSVLLEIIIDENNSDEQEIYFIGDEWAAQTIAKIYARSGLASAMTATGGNLGKIIPGGNGPEGILGEYLGGRQRTNYVRGTTRRRKHSLTAKNQLANLKRIGTSNPGSTVGQGNVIYEENSKGNLRYRYNSTINL